MSLTLKFCRFITSMIRFWIQVRVQMSSRGVLWFFGEILRLGHDFYNFKGLQYWFIAYFNSFLSFFFLPRGNYTNVVQITNWVIRFLLKLKSHLSVKNGFSLLFSIFSVNVKCPTKWPARNTYRRPSKDDIWCEHFFGHKTCSSCSTFNEKAAGWPPHYHE